jgi:5-methylcytosine-specific restriction enzyme subunit McrC
LKFSIKPYESWEHGYFTISKEDCPDWNLIENKPFGKRKNSHCYLKTLHDEGVNIEIGYYIGVDWLIENHSAVIVAPKLNTRLEDIINAEKNNQIEVDNSNNVSAKGKIVNIDYFAMLRQCLDTDYLYTEIDELVHIDWNAKEIPIKQNEDWLSPLLVVKFLNVLKSIVRKGLKKSYYPTIQNLNSKIKGKILVGQNIKQNVLKNRLNQTVCRFDEFGIDSPENRILNKAFQFSCSYLDNHRQLFVNSVQHFSELISFCTPAFEFVSNEANISDIKNFRPNPFFKEYREGIELAKLILKRYAYTISNTNKDIITTPPYWIDMPRLFELYVYRFLKTAFPKKGEVQYHLATYGNELDFLINSGDTKMVIDAKYKSLYIYGKNHNDIRQVSGYARLEKVYDKLGLDENKTVDCLIIYPDIENGKNLKNFIPAVFQKMTEISGYKKFYKIGIQLPTI